MSQPPKHIKKYRVNAVASFNRAHKSHAPATHCPPPTTQPAQPPKPPKTGVSKRKSHSSEFVASTVVETLVDRGRVRGGRDKKRDAKGATNRADRFQVMLNSLEGDVSSLKRKEESLERRLHLFVKQTHGLSSVTDDYHDRLETLSRSCKALASAK